MTRGASQLPAGEKNKDKFLLAKILGYNPVIYYLLWIYYPEAVKREGKHDFCPPCASILLGSPMPKQA